MEDSSAKRLFEKSGAHECPILSTVWLYGRGSDIIVTGDMDGNMSAWRWLDEENRLEPLDQMPAHCLGVATLTANPDRTICLSFSLDCEIRVYDAVNNLERMNSFSRTPLYCWGVSLFPDGSKFACGSINGKVEMYSVENDNAVAEYESGGRFVLSSSFTTDGRSLAAGTQDGLIYIFDTETSAMQHSLTGHAKAVRTMEFSQDGILLFSGAEDKFLVTHDLREGCKSSFSVSGQNSWITSVAAMPDACHVITSSTDAVVRVWDVRNRRCSDKFKGRKSSVWDVSLNLIGNRLVSVDDDGKIMVHDTTNLCRPAPLSTTIIDVIDSAVSRTQ